MIHLWLKVDAGLILHLKGLLIAAAVIFQPFNNNIAILLTLVYFLGDNILSARIACLGQNSELILVLIIGAKCTTGIFPIQMTGGRA